MSRQPTSSSRDANFAPVMVSDVWSCGPAPQKQRNNEHVDALPDAFMDLHIDTNSNLQFSTPTASPLDTAKIMFTPEGFSISECSWRVQGHQQPMPIKRISSQINIEYLPETFTLLIEHRPYALGEGPPCRLLDSSLDWPLIRSFANLLQPNKAAACSGSEKSWSLQALGRRLLEHDHAYFCEHGALSSIFRELGTPLVDTLTEVGMFREPIGKGPDFGWHPALIDECIPTRIYHDPNGFPCIEALFPPDILTVAQQVGDGHMSDAEGADFCCITFNDLPNSFSMRFFSWNHSTLTAGSERPTPRHINPSSSLIDVAYDSETNGFSILHQRAQPNTKPRTLSDEDLALITNLTDHLRPSRAKDSRQEVVTWPLEALLQRVREHLAALEGSEIVDGGLDLAIAKESFGRIERVLGRGPEPAFVGDGDE